MTIVIIIGVIVFFWFIYVYSNKNGSSIAGEYYQTEKVTGSFQFNTKIAGVTYNNKKGTSRQKLVKKLRTGDILYLIPDRHHKHDPNAIAVLNQSEQNLGYLPSTVAANLKHEIEAGKKFFAQVEEVTGGGMFKNTGVNIAVFEVDY